MNFVIDPDRLLLNNVFKISKKSFDILLEKKIKLMMDVYDSDEKNTNKPILVFIHGNSTSKKVFNEQIECFSKDYRVINFDLLGHGESSKICDIEDISEEEKDVLSEDFYNIHAMIAEVIQLIKSKNIKKAHFVGWSLGGHIAYGIAAAAPEFVASITTIASPPVEFSTIGFKNGFYEFFVNQLIPEWIKNPTRNLPNAKATAEYNGYSDIEGKDQFFIEDLKGTDPKMRKFLFLKMDQHKNEITNGEIFVNSTQLPICLIIGEYDSGTRVDYMLKFKTHFKNELSQTHLVKGAKHAVFRTNKDEFFKILNNFIKSVLQLEYKCASCHPSEISSWKKVPIKLGMAAAATSGLLFMAYKIYNEGIKSIELQSMNKLNR